MFPESNLPLPSPVLEFSMEPCDTVPEVTICPDPNETSPPQLSTPGVEAVQFFVENFESILVEKKTGAIGSINSHYFHIIGDGKLNPIIGFYIPI